VKISVVGCGHVGLTTAACLSHIGHEVLGVDEDEEKLGIVAGGEVPFHEPGLGELIQEGLDTGRLRFSSDSEESVRHGNVVFICVGTPTKPSGEANLLQVERVARRIARRLKHYTVVVEKSTVPVETGAWVRRAMDQEAPPEAEFDVASNPEFLREGRAVQDTLEPERIVVGAPSERAAEVLSEVYRPVVDTTGCELIVTDIATAELIKHASNAFLATKISFINMIADVCERTGADVEVVADSMGLDQRIGPLFLRAGIGFGGECLPKDIRAFRHKARQLGVDTGILEAVERLNDARIDGYVEKIRSMLWHIEGKRVALWGLAFKPDTDDLRQAPALKVAQRLVDSGAEVSVHDPVALAEAKSILDSVSFSEDPYEAARDADCLTICTEWPEYAATDLGRLREAMGQPIVIDGRNVLEPAKMAEAGFLYASIGRPPAGGNGGRLSG
jgi:UDPglucose 6-dehydrogenase